MKLRSLLLSRTVLRWTLIGAGALALVVVGFLSPTATQQEMFERFWPVYFLAAASIACGVLASEE